MGMVRSPVSDAEGWNWGMKGWVTRTTISLSSSAPFTQPYPFVSHVLYFYCMHPPLSYNETNSQGVIYYMGVGVEDRGMWVCGWRAMGVHICVFVNIGVQKTCGGQRAASDAGSSFPPSLQQCLIVLCRVPQLLSLWAPRDSAVSISHITLGTLRLQMCDIVSALHGFWASKLPSSCLPGKYVIHWARKIFKLVNHISVKFSPKK